MIERKFTIFISIVEGWNGVVRLTSLRLLD